MVSTLAVVALLMLESETRAVEGQQLKPVTFTVVDVVTRKPVTEFSFTLELTVPGEVDLKGTRAKAEPICVRSPSGTFQVQAPASCKIDLQLISPDTVLGSLNNRSSDFMVLSTDHERKFVVNLEIGHSVAGIIRDAETKRPIPGARVVASDGRWRRLALNDKHATLADQNGRFVVHGVKLEWGVVAFHPDYQQRSVPERKGDTLPSRDLVIDLERAERVTIRGVVRDDEQQPVAGVLITAGETVTESTPDGRFCVSVPRPDYELHTLVFRRAGFAEQEMDQTFALGKELSVVLVPYCNVEGTVRSSDGRPVESFTVVVGPRLEPHGYHSVTREVHDARGHFSASVTDPGQNRVVLRAEGHAVWEGTVAAARNSAALEIGLRPGVSVLGKVARPMKTRSHSRDLDACSARGFRVFKQRRWGTRAGHADG